MMPMEDRGHSTYENIYIGVDILNGFNKSYVVGDEFAFVILPVTRVGVVETKMYYGDVRNEFEGFLKFLLFIVRTMSFA
jgi:hypothetical protein